MPYFLSVTPLQCSFTTTKNLFELFAFTGKKFVDEVDWNDTWTRLYGL